MLWNPLLFLQFYEDLVDGKGSDEKPKGIPDKPLNKKIKFEDSDSSDDEDEDHSGEEADNGNGNDVEKGETAPAEQQQEVLNTSVPASKDDEEQAGTAEEPKEKKQRVEDPPVSEQIEHKETADEPKESTDKPKESTDKPKESTTKQKESTERNIDDLIDEDLKELGDRKKVCLLSGCNYSLIICCSAPFCYGVLHVICTKEQTEVSSIFCRNKTSTSVYWCHLFFIIFVLIKQASAYELRGAF